jgi:hypothetical protein
MPLAEPGEPLGKVSHWRIGPRSESHNGRARIGLRWKGGGRQIAARPEHLGGYSTPQRSSLGAAGIHNSDSRNIGFLRAGFPSGRRLHFAWPASLRRLLHSPALPVWPAISQFSGRFPQPRPCPAVFWGDKTFLTLAHGETVFAPPGSDMIAPAVWESGGSW